METSTSARQILSGSAKLVERLNALLRDFLILYFSVDVDALKFYASVKYVPMKVVSVIQQLMFERTYLTTNSTGSTNSDLKIFQKKIATIRVFKHTKLKREVVFKSLLFLKSTCFTKNYPFNQ